MLQYFSLNLRQNCQMGNEYKRRSSKRCLSESMMASFTSHSCFLLFFLFCTHVMSLKCDCNEETVYAIRNGKWALDVKQLSNASIYAYDGSASQQFLVQCARKPGLFYITNKSTGARLDVVRDIFPHPVVIKEPDGTFWQQWFLHADGHIFNAALQSYLDVQYGDFKSGAHVQVYPARDGIGPPNQVWKLVKV